MSETISLPDYCEHITRLDIIGARLNGASNEEIYEACRNHDREFHPERLAPAD